MQYTQYSALRTSRSVNKIYVFTSLSYTLFYVSQEESDFRKEYFKEQLSLIALVAIMELPRVYVSNWLLVFSRYFYAIVWFLFQI